MITPQQTPKPKDPQMCCVICKKPFAFKNPQVDNYGWHLNDKNIIEKCAYQNMPMNVHIDFQSIPPISAVPLPNVQFVGNLEPDEFVIGFSNKELITNKRVINVEQKVSDRGDNSNAGPNVGAGPQ